jgi:hypothetical protein
MKKEESLVRVSLRLSSSIFHSIKMLQKTKVVVFILQIIQLLLATNANS